MWSGQNWTKIIYINNAVNAYSSKDCGTVAKNDNVQLKNKKVKFCYFLTFWQGDKIRGGTGHKIFLQ